MYMNSLNETLGQVFSVLFSLYQMWMSVQNQTLEMDQVHSALRPASTLLVLIAAPATVVTNFI